LETEDSLRGLFDVQTVREEYVEVQVAMDHEGNLLDEMMSFSYSGSVSSGSGNA